MEFTKIENPSPDERCSFCFSAVNNPLRYGEMFKYKHIITHYFCVLMSTGIKQSGNDDEGLYGFLIKDIEKGLERARDVKCMYCKRGGATAQCNHYVRSTKKKCLTTFHLTCGVTHGSQHLFFGQFQSLCHLHRRNQKVPSEFIKDSAVTCGMCFDMIHDVNYSTSSLWAPCCKKYYYHRDCVQQLAFTSGGYHFRCPLCNNESQFKIAMQKCGIFVPIRDALWETEPNAFSELYVEHNQCDTEPCLCPHSTKEGDKRTYNNGAWDLIRCVSCGSEGTHRPCSGLPLTGDVSWNCGSCQAVLKRKQEDGEGERDEIQKTIEPDTCCAYYCVCNKGRDHQTDKGMYKTVYCVQCELSWIHARCRTIETNGEEKRSSDWTCVGCLASDNEGSTESNPIPSTSSSSSTSHSILSIADKVAIEEKTKKPRGRPKGSKVKNDAEDPLLPSGSSIDSPSTSKISEHSSSFSSPASSISNEETSAKLIDINKKQERRVSRRPRSSYNPTLFPSSLISSTPPPPSSVITPPITPDTASTSDAPGSSKPETSRLNASDQASPSRKPGPKSSRLNTPKSSPSKKKGTDNIPLSQRTTLSARSSNTRKRKTVPTGVTSPSSLPETPPDLSPSTKSSSSTSLLSPPVSTPSSSSAMSNLPGSAKASSPVEPFKGFPSKAVKTSTTDSSNAVGHLKEVLSTASKASMKSKKASKDVLSTSLKASVKSRKSLKSGYCGPTTVDGFTEPRKRQFFKNVLDVFVKQYDSTTNDNDFYKYYLNTLITQLQLPDLKDLYYQARLKLGDLPKRIPTVNKPNAQLTNINRETSKDNERSRTHDPNTGSKDANNDPGDESSPGDKTGEIAKRVKTTDGVPSKVVKRGRPKNNLMHQIIESIKRARLTYGQSSNEETNIEGSTDANKAPGNELSPGDKTGEIDKRVKTTDGVPSKVVKRGRPKKSTPQIILTYEQYSKPPETNVEPDIQMDMVSSTSESIPSPHGITRTQDSATNEDSDDIICLSDEDDDECMVVDEENTKAIKDEDIEVVDAKLSFSWTVTGFKDVPIQVVSIHEVDTLPWVMGEPKCSDDKSLPDDDDDDDDVQTIQDSRDDLDLKQTDKQLPSAHSSYIIPSSSLVKSPQPKAPSNPPPNSHFIVIRPVIVPPTTPSNAIQITNIPTPIRFATRDVINGQNNVSDSQTGVRRISSDVRHSKHISSDVTLVPCDTDVMDEPSGPLFKVTNVIGSVGLDPKSAQTTSHSAATQTVSIRRSITNTQSDADSNNSTASTDNPSNAASTSIDAASAERADPEIISLSDDEDDLIILS
ncbi:hypothetical protein WDU94_011927 [Cyamophila willieti]